MHQVIPVNHVWHGHQGATGKPSLADAMAKADFLRSIFEPRCDLFEVPVDTVMVMVMKIMMIMMVMMIIIMMIR